MESDTLAYDGDMEAWAQWQVPLPPPAATCGLSTGAADASDAAADAPTLNYELEQQVGNESVSARDAGDSSEYPGVPAVGAFESQPDSVVRSHVAPGSVNEGPTLAYDTQMVLDELPQDPVPTAIRDPVTISPNAAATQAYETQMFSPKRTAAICDPATISPSAAATQAYETQMLSPKRTTPIRDPVTTSPSAAATQAYETQMFSGALPAGMPETQVMSAVTATMPAMNRHGAQDAAAFLSPAVVYGETQEVGPTLEYGEDAFIMDAPGIAAAENAATATDGPTLADAEGAFNAAVPQTVEPMNAGSLSSQHERARAARYEPVPPAAVAGDSPQAGSSRKRSAPSPRPPSISASVEATSVSHASSVSAPPVALRRFRIVGKQPPRGAFAIAARAAASAPTVAANVISSSAAASSSPASARTSRTSASTARDERREAPQLAAPPRELLDMGCKVLVRGDGWGGGHGEYLATVTEADSLTFTVIRQVGEKWEETHVLREQCKILNGESGQRKERRR